MKKILFHLVVFVLLAVTLTACGGGGPPTKIKSSMTDFKFDPTEYTIAAGKEITLEIENVGAASHEFVIMKHGLTVGDKFGPEDEENIYWEVEVESGKSDTVTFTAPTETGEYQVVCGTEGHVEKGMIAKLIVLSAP